MSIFRLILITITLSIILNLFYKIIVKHNIIEGATGIIAQNNEMNKINSLYGTGILLSNFQADKNNNLQFKLKELFIKSSYNSAFTGTYMNTDMIKFVLKRGCRYIDFEISKIDGDLYVSADTLEKDNCIKLVDAIGSINKSLFGTDPLFINLRFKNTDTITYDELKIALISLTTNKLRYSGRRIDNTTRIIEVMGKCVVIGDSNIKSSTGVSVFDMVVNEKVIDSYTNSEIRSLAPIRKDFDSNRIIVVNPDAMRSGILSWLDPAAVDLKLIVANHSANIIPYSFYSKSIELDSYESIFNDYNRTIIQRKYLDKSYFEKLEKKMDLV